MSQFKARRDACEPHSDTVIAMLPGAGGDERREHAGLLAERPGTRAAALRARATMTARVVHWCGARLDECRMTIGFVASGHGTKRNCVEYSAVKCWIKRAHHTGAFTI
jgi:hypothetical protein